MLLCFCLCVLTLHSRPIHSPESLLYVTLLASLVAHRKSQVLTVTLELSGAGHCLPSSRASRFSPAELPVTGLVPSIPSVLCCKAHPCHSRSPFPSICNPFAWLTSLKGSPSVRGGFVCHQGVSIR